MRVFARRNYRWHQSNTARRLARIVGVVRGGLFRSLREAVEPQIFFDRGNYRRLVIRFANDPAALRTGIEPIWRRALPDLPLRLSFADERLAAFYDADAKRSAVLAAFAAVAVTIACLGLLGLATLRRKGARARLASARCSGREDSGA